MFYYRITHRRSRGATATRTNEYRECLRPEDVGAAVAAKVKAPGTTSVTATKISQRAYIAATRPKD
jgi:hypothetical protein